MALVVLITILVYIILIVWTWHNLGFIEKTKKIAANTLKKSIGRSSLMRLIIMSKILAPSL